MSDTAIENDRQALSQWLAERPDTTSVANFVPGPGIHKLSLRFDITRLREALDQCLARHDFMGDMQAQGFAALPLTRNPDTPDISANDLSGRYWLRPDDGYQEVAREEQIFPYPTVLPPHRDQRTFPAAPAHAYRGVALQRPTRLALPIYPASAKACSARCSPAGR